VISSSISNGDQYIENPQYQKMKRWVEKDILELLVMVVSGVHDSNKPLEKEDTENTVI